MRLLGIDINGIKKFCAFMDLPKPVFQVTYDKIVSNIAIATACVRTLYTNRLMFLWGYVDRCPSL
ncbi:hypothetical protein ALC57_07775 [Trachymyrmex cornetzi]|uniref:Uncharacterized protein n=1 Tax=Trachymyrmex cornetzi TaxID=471704 RepID=A0A151J7N0_9HYME|nr:hypothetical protein ALC57_07775 [Trachymyrmex cornetzi]